MSARNWFAASLLAYAAAWAGALAWLPERVPIHFGGWGEPDQWTDKSGALITFALIGTLLAGLLGGCAVFVGRLPVSLMNTPHKDWWTATPERIAQMRVRARTDLYAIGTATMTLLAVVVLMTVRAARADDPRVDGWFFVALALYLVFLGVWLVRAYRAARPPDDEPSGTSTKYLNG